MQTPSEPAPPRRNRRAGGKNLYFRHSDKMGVLGAMLIVTGGGLAAAAGGAIYAYATYYLPLSYSNVAFAPILGFGLGYTIVKLARLGKTRSPFIVAILGLFLGLSAEYWNWVFSASLLAETKLSLDLETLRATGSMLIREGSSHVFGHLPKGALLKLMWAVEGAVIVASSGLWAYLCLSAAPYCERCDQWLGEPTRVRVAPIHDPIQFVKLVERGDFSPLNLPPASPSDLECTELRLHRCHRCCKMHLLTVLAIKKIAIGDGKTSDKGTAILMNLIIDAGIFDWILHYVATGRQLTKINERAANSPPVHASTGLENASARLG